MIVAAAISLLVTIVQAGRAHGATEDCPQLNRLLLVGYGDGRWNVPGANDQFEPEHGFVSFFVDDGELAMNSARDRALQLAT
jgi:hypothetical protein